MKKASSRRPLAPSNRFRQASFSLLCLLVLFGAGFRSEVEAARSPRQRRTVAARHRKVSKRAGHELKMAARHGADRKEALGRPEALEGVFEGDGEDVEGRLKWFMSQRTYPFKTIPEGARQRAWESRPRNKGPETEEIQSWRSIGPTPTSSYAPLFSNFGYNSGRINAIAVSPANSQLILVGASTGGIWRSIDGGANFTPVSDNQVDLSVGSIAFSRSNPAIVYAGLGDMPTCCGYLGSGILRSTDGGQTWTHVNNSTLPQPGAVGKIEVDPSDSNRVYVALYRTLDSTTDNSFPYGGVYLSTDGGINWTNTLAGLPRDLAVDPTASSPQQRILYAAMRGTGSSGDGGTGGVYRSTNGGVNWTLVYTSSYPHAFLSGGLRDIRVALSPANPQKIYVYSGKTAGSTPSEIRISVSTNGGASFSFDSVLTTVDKGQFGYNTYLVADPLNADTIYIGARDVFKSTNGGQSWTNITKNYSSTFKYQPFSSDAHPDQHCLTFAPGDSNTVYIGNDGGIYRSTDGGTSFSSLNSTLSLTQFVSIARHPTDPAITYGGTQDNGTQKRSSAGSGQWEDFASGDGGRVVIDPTDPHTIYTTYVFGTVRRWRNDGATSDLRTDETDFGESTTDPRIAFYPPFTGNGVDSTLYFGTWKLFISSNQGANWTAPSAVDLTYGIPPGAPASAGDVLSAIGVSRSNPNVIYTGSEGGRVMVTTDGGVNWTDITSGLPDRFIASITVDPANSAVAYLTVSGFGSGHIFRTNNRGASWSDISGNLPNIPTSALLIDPTNPSELYAGTDIGVFRSTSGGNSWQTFNNGLPPVVVTAFTTDSSGQVQLATYGRGAYEAVNVVGCNYAISPNVEQSFPNTGGSGSVSVTAGGGCAWSALSNTPWIATFNIGQEGPGNGQINFFVAPNNTNSARVGSITIAGQTLIINQAAGNVIDDAQTFVRQQYRDFLNRQPDDGGLGYWTGQITQCGSNAQCIHDRRVGVADAFFFEDEFQKTGAYIYRVFKAALGRRPLFSEFSADRGRVVAGSNLDQSKSDYALFFVQQNSFLQIYPRSQPASVFVDNLLNSIKQNSNVDLSGQRAAFINLYDGTDNGRAAILKQIADTQAFIDGEYNNSFVLMEYFGYLQRDPDDGGFNFWIGQVNKFPLRNVGIQHAMACSFITSAEYQQRFNSVVTHTNRECPQ